MSHEEIGLASVHPWNLAEELKMAVGYRQRPDNTPARTTFVQLGHDANALARVCGIGSGAQQSSEGEEHLEGAPVGFQEILLRERLDSDVELLIAAPE